MKWYEQITYRNNEIKATNRRSESVGAERRGARTAALPWRTDALCCTVSLTPQPGSQSLARSSAAGGQTLWRWWSYLAPCCVSQRLAGACLHGAGRRQVEACLYIGAGGAWIGGDADGHMTYGRSALQAAILVSCSNRERIGIRIMTICRTTYCTGLGLLR